MFSPEKSLRKAAGARSIPTSTVSRYVTSPLRIHLFIFSMNCRRSDRSTTPHDHLSRIPNRQNKAVRPSPRRVERKTDEGTLADVPGGTRRISRRAKRRKVQHDYRRVSCDDDT